MIDYAALDAISPEWTQSTYLAPWVSVIFPIALTPALFVRRLRWPALLVLTALVLSGCAAGRPVAWRHVQHANPQAFRADMMACETYAAQVAPYRAASFHPAANPGTMFLFGERYAHYEAAVVECMGTRGYYLERQPYDEAATIPPQR